MKNRDVTEYLFSLVGYGKENAVKRSPCGGVDRIFRNITHRWNRTKGNHPIINAGYGYYKPRPGIPAEEREFREYISKEESRIRQETDKLENMKAEFYRMGIEEEQPNTAYEQLSLPV